MSAKHTTHSDQANQEAVRVLTPPAPQLPSLAPSVTISVYTTVGCEALGGALYPSQGKSKFQRFTDEKGKRRMLVLAKPEQIFRGGAQVRGLATYFSRPTPTLAFANGSLPVSSPGILAAANLFIHFPKILWLAISPKGGNRLFSNPI
jgi:hypothetical protein